MDRYDMILMNENMPVMNATIPVQKVRIYK